MSTFSILRFLVVIRAIIIVSAFVVNGYSNASAQDPTLPAGVANALRESQLEHEEAMKKRFEPIIQDLSRGFDSDYAQLYSDAIRAVFFANDTASGAGWREWQEENKSILEDPRLPLATEASALYLQGHLYTVLERQDDASACYIKVLNILANGPQNLAGFHLMQESLTTTLLFKYYNIAPEYLDTKDTYCGSIAGAEQLFKGLVLPNAIKSDPRNIESYWNTAITAIGKASSLSDTQVQKFNVDDYPRLVLEESQCLMQLGQKKEAIYLLEQLLSSYPDSPRYKEISDALVAASTPDPAVPVTATTSASPPTH
jgi:tetratricopeptide (TPR) repeat protein